MYCRYCGKQIDDSAIACPECGMPVKRRSASSQEPGTMQYTGVSGKVPSAVQSSEPSKTPGMEQGTPSAAKNGDMCKKGQRKLTLPIYDILSLTAFALICLGMIVLIIASTARTRAIIDLDFIEFFLGAAALAQDALIIIGIFSLSSLIIGTAGFAMCFVGKSKPVGKVFPSCVFILSVVYAIYFFIMLGKFYA